MRGLAGLATLTNKLLLGGRAKVPGIFIPCRLAARCKPLRFSNRKIKEVLGWKPRYSLDEALDRSFAAENGRESTGRTRARAPGAESPPLRHSSAVKGAA